MHTHSGLRSLFMLHHSLFNSAKSRTNLSNIYVKCVSITQVHVKTQAACSLFTTIEGQLKNLVTKGIQIQIQFRFRQDASTTRLIMYYSIGCIFIS